jgi:photosystem II stability/assembly factor-like uncharacterized protein
MRVITSWMALLTLIATAALAGPNRWTTFGPEGAVVRQVLTDPTVPNVAYARTEGGIYKTSNSGESWRPSNDGLPKGGITALLVTTGSPTTLYVAIDGAIFSSTNAGEHWTRRGKIGSVVVSCLALDLTSQTLLAGTTTGVYVSDDSGQTWTQSATSAQVGPALSIFSIAASATAAYAIVYRSAPPYGAGILRSADRGRTWDIVIVSGASGDDPPEPPSALAVSLERGSIYIAAGQWIFVSNDDGKTWHRLPQVPAFIPVNAVVPVGEGNLYASTRAGVFQYNLRANSWTAVGNGNPVGNLAVTSSAPRRLYGAAEFGIVTILEGDRHWVAVNSGLPGANAFDVAIAGAQPAIAYTTTAAGVFRSDGGPNWRLLNVNSGGQHMVVDPRTANTAYVTGDNLMKTTDGGTTWKGVVTNFASNVAIAASDPATLYAVLSKGMSKSTDAGGTWSPVMSGLYFDYFDYYGFTASSLAIDPSNSSNVYLAKYSGLYKTTDGGASWNRASQDRFLRSLAIDSSDGLTIYAGRETSGVIKSSDAGTTWSTTGLIDKRVNALAMNAKRLYAGTGDGHVYSSDDGGVSWSGLDDGLTCGSVSRLIVDASGQYLYAATSTGVYSYLFVDQNVRPERLPDDVLRLPRTLDDVLSAAGEKVAFVIPVIGTATGMGGTLFTADVTLTNNRDPAQDVLAIWLPRGGSSEGVASFRLTIPPSGDTSGETKITDVAQRFGISGIGSLAVVAVDAGGKLDANASIDGSARIWINPADGRAPLSQFIPAARASLFSEHSRAQVAGLAQDAQFRTNAGIVNLSSEWHQFTVQINGELASGQFTFSAPPFSLVQVPLPDGDYGKLSLDVFTDSSITRWLSYGNSIDRTSGEAQTSLGIPVRN